jgi:uncharacterized membrane protein YagU involved in acid resistance
MKQSVRLLLGLLGGMSASAPMAAAMTALHRRLPPSRRYALPPREIVSKILPAKSDESETLLTLASHFGYGGMMGLLYSACVRKTGESWIGRGLLAGLIVWAVSYFLLLPLAGILRPAHKHPPERSVLMLVAHFVWGLTLTGFLASVKGDSSGISHGSARPHRDRA